MKALLFFLFILCMACSQSPQNDSLLIEGETLINPGNSFEIIESSYVYIEKEMIISYGKLVDKPKKIVSEKTIPILLFQGTSDWRVIPEESLNMDFELQKQKYSIVLLCMNEVITG